MPMISECHTYIYLVKLDLCIFYTLLHIIHVDPMLYIVPNSISVFCIPILFFTMCLTERERVRGQTSINYVYLSYKAYQFRIPIDCSALE